MVAASTVGFGQRVSDDHARSINSKMQRLPASVAASTVVHRSPFAFAHNRPSRAVDDEMDGSSRWDAAEVQPRETDFVGRAWCGRGLRDRHPSTTRPTARSLPPWRKGNRKTRRSVNAVSIAQSENVWVANS